MIRRTAAMGARARSGSMLKAMLLAGVFYPLAGQALAAELQAAAPQPTPPVGAEDQTPVDRPRADVAPAAEPDEVDQETDLGGVVVTGIRATIQSSIETKRESQTIVDALSSEEIGELPALSIGEAIQTITGAATHRDKGGATEIAIRGLGPFLGASTFNGREATNGSGDRSVNFGQFPSELVNQIKIYKTQQANLIEGGVSGLIELGTLRPLDYGKRRFQVEAKGQYSPYQERISYADSVGFRGTVSYVDQFEMGGLGELGVSLGFQKNDTSNPEEVFSGSTTWNACDDSRTVTGNCPTITRAQGNAGVPFYLIPNSYQLRQIVEHDERDAIFAALQWQPNDAVNVNFDYQYSERNFAERRSELNLSEVRNGVRNRVVENHILKAFEGSSSVESISLARTRSETYKGGGFTVAWEASDDLTLSTDISYSKTYRSEFDRQTRLRTDTVDINNVRTVFPTRMIPYTFDARNGDLPTITFDPRFDPTNHAVFSGVPRLRRDEQVREDEIKAVRLDLDYDTDLKLLTRLHAGLRLSERQYNDFDDRREVNLSNRNQTRAANLACRTEFPQKDFLENASGNNIKSYAAFDPICLFREFLGTEDPGRNNDLRSTSNRDVNERVTAAYVMAEYETQAGALPLSGNFGLRAVQTEVTSTGLRSALNVVANPDGTIRLVSTGDFTEVVIESDTLELLPSLNAILELRPEVLLRGAVYRAMSRAAPSSLGAGRNFELETGSGFTSIDEAVSRVVATGSPRLEPLMSWNGDISLEWYPNKDSLFSAAVYYKQFQGGYVPVAINETFVIGGQTITTPVVQTQNTDEASTLYGLELTLTHRFANLPAPFDGLGFKLSYNYADADFETHDILLGDVIDPITGALQKGIIPPAGIFGLSNHVMSAQLYYQIGGLDLQGIYNYRSEYYQDFVGGNSQLRYIRENSTVDLRASYQINRNVSIRAEAVNVFDEPRYQDMPVKGSLREYNTYGPRYFAGIRFRF